MNKLTLEHLAPYLPYGLKVQFDYKRIDKIIEKRIATINLIDSVWDRCNINNGSISYDLIYFDEIKPILRPLSDLTKEIEVNGEKFVPIEVLKHRYDFIYSSLNKYNLDKWEFRVIQKLFQWHFDVFGLIPQNLAIDFNTL